MSKLNEYWRNRDGDTSSDLSACVRNVPYPYRGMIAFASDIDGANLSSFCLVHRVFLGIAHGFTSAIHLELTNSFWVFSDDRSGCKISLQPKQGAPPLEHGHEVAELVRAGVLDTLHTFGNFNNGGFSRSFADSAVREFERLGLSVPVWTYHGNHANAQNILRPPHWVADDPNSQVYHADLLPSLGIRHICLPRMTTKVGDVAPVGAVTLLDGQRFWGFERFCQISDHPDFDKIEAEFENHQQPFIRSGFRRSENKAGSWSSKLTVWNLSLLKHQIATRVIDELCGNELIGIFAQHLTRPNDPGLKDPETLLALEALSARQVRGEVLVAGLGRTLDFARVRQNIEYRIDRRGEDIVVDIINLRECLRNDPTFDEASLEGISFEVKAPHAPKLFLFGKPVKSAVTVEEGSGSWVLYVPWRQRLGSQCEALLKFETAAGKQSGG